MKYLKQTTHKLFYKKWSYKIKCYCKGSWMIKRLGIQQTVKRCLQKKSETARTVWPSDFEPEELLDFLQAVEIYLDKDIHIRAEGRIFSIYCNDEGLFKKICKRMDRWVQAVFEPANDAEFQFMQDNGHKKIICNHLPFQRYQYRVHFKERMPLDFREKLWAWIIKYDGKMRVPIRVENWLKGSKQWVTAPNVYVEDGPMLSMMLLFLGDRLSKVEEFVPRSVINIQSKEIPCPV